MTARVRLRVIVPAVLAGTVLAMGAWAGYRSLYPHNFVAEWDSNVAATAPVIFPIAKADPALHRLMVDKTEAAFKQGGWPAASQVFFKIADNRINIYAGDTAILACRAAWRDVYRALLPTPHVCAQMLVNGTGLSVTHGLASGAIAREIAACDEVTRDGGRRRLSVDPPGHMDTAEAGTVFSRALDAPTPLPADERETLDNPARRNERSWCSATLHLDENIAALPGEVAARFYRAQYDTDSGDFMYGAAETPLTPGPPPADFHCAPAGTRFTLSMESSTSGLPIVWTSLGQDGWDCRISSSASGVRGLFAPDNYPRANAMRMLWPLAAGKTAHCHCSYGKVSDYRVEGPLSLWLPTGTTQAWAIDNTVRASDGTVLYTVMKYWSPSLGFFVGQRTVVASGGWPEGVAPDWQVVAVNRPAG